MKGSFCISLGLRYSLPPRGKEGHCSKESPRWRWKAGGRHPHVVSAKGCVRYGVC